MQKTQKTQKTQKMQKMQKMQKFAKNTKNSKNAKNAKIQKDLKVVKSMSSFLSPSIKHFVNSKSSKLFIFSFCIKSLLSKASRLIICKLNTISIFNPL